MEIVDTVITNSIGSNGDGISIAQAIIEKGIKAVLTEYCSLITLQVLSHAGVKVMTGASGKIRDVLRDYLSGKLKDITKTSVTSVSGIEVRKMQGVDSVGKTEIEEPLNQETLEVMQHEWDLVWPKVGE
jgi:predicted Fe-Mo cluster-binding NifX family protein